MWCSGLESSMKWLSKTQYVYAITNTVTGARYVGSTEVSPFGRWADLILELRRGDGNARFQAAWAAHPSLTFWTFQVLVEISPKVDTRRLRAIEAEHITGVAESYRLNMPGLRDEAYARVMELLATGAKYADIRDETGVSMGMISKLKNTCGAPSDSDRVRVSTHRA